MDSRTAQQRAIGKALAMGGAGAVTRVRFGLYQVRSATRPGAQHTVSQDAGGRLHCSCEAGLSGKPCWHAGAVYVAKVESGGGRVTRAATPEAPQAEAPSNVIPLRRAA